MRRRAYGSLPLLLPFFGFLLLGCERSQAQLPPPEQTPEVMVSLPITRQVTDYEDFPGRTEATNSVDVRARVTGYLEKVCFKEGADVRQGDLLFEIDPRPYQTELARAEGSVVQGEGRLRRLGSDHQRAVRLLAQGAIGREEFDKIVGDHTDATGALAIAKATREMAQLNMEFTKVRSPLSGHISRRYVDPGNLVKADETSLTTIVSLDPMYVYFDLDERTALRLQRLFRERHIDWASNAGLPVMLGLADEDGFSKQGTINFADNRVDPDTGTWRLRGVFKNADRSLSPGLFVRIRLPVGDPYQAMLISEQAVSTDQGQKSVFVVDDANTVAQRRVKVGRLHGGLRVITDGLGPKERVVVRGLQLVRPGLVVNPELVDMPAAAEANPSVSHSSEKKPR